MSFRVLLDVTTRGLNEAEFNVKNSPNLITVGVAARMIVWYNRNFKKTALNIIKTGRPISRIQRNVGRYAIEKERKYGISHGLGIRTGGLWLGVASTRLQIKHTRGREVRLLVVFDDPYYLAFVVDGTRNHIGRNFVLVAQEMELPKLVNSIGKMFDGLDFTRPHPELLSTIIGPSSITGLRGV